MSSNLHITPAFQVICNQDGTVFAHEALMRFNGDLSKSPQRQILQWESARFMSSVDVIMLRILQNIDYKNLSIHHLFVNLSAQSIQHCPFAVIRAMTNLRALFESVVVEITETYTQISIDEISKFSAFLETVDVKLAFDDLSPLSKFNKTECFKKVKPGYIKIGNVDFALSKTDCFLRRRLEEMIRDAKMAGAAVIVEQIENDQDIQHAIAIGADYFQGYFFGKPFFKSTDKNTADAHFATVV